MKAILDKEFNVYVEEIASRLWFSFVNRESIGDIGIDSMSTCSTSQVTIRRDKNEPSY